MAEVFVGPDVTGDGVADADITPAGSFVEIGGVTFTDAVNAGSGTGNYNTFLAIQDDNDVGDDEAGFNSEGEGTGNHELKSFTHVVKLSDLVITTIDGVQYYEFRTDLNEANSDPNAQISLDQFKLYTSTDGTIVDTDVLFTQNPIYDMDAGGNVSVLLSDAESSGSGNDDYAVLVPVSEFAGLDPATTYVYLYTQMGAAGADWGATSTFEEWNLQNGVTLTGTKFEDANNNGLKDVGEGPVEGVTIFIDANQNGVLDAGERTTLTDANGNYTFYGVATGQTVWIDEVVPAGATQTTGAHEEVIIGDNATPGSTVVVDPIGNFIARPAYTLTKAVTSITGGVGTNGLDGADSDGDTVNYTIVVTNTGNVAITGYTINDPNADTLVLSSGDTNTNSILDVGETWTYSATHIVDQAELDGQGTDNTGAIDGDEDTDNTVYVTTTNAGNKDASDDSPLVYNPDFTVTKVADSITGGTGTDGLDGADSDGDVVNYTITIANTGNITLTGFSYTDDNADGDVIAYVSGDTDTDGDLDVSETWIYSATHTVTQDELDSKGTDNTGALDTDGDTDNRVTVSFNEAGPKDADADTPLVYNPDFTVTKVADSITGGVGTDGLDGADSDGDVVNYTITIANTGNITLTGFSYTDDNADGDVIAYVSGDTDTDGDLDVSETWIYSATHTVTQAELEGQGTDNTGAIDGDGDTDNRVTVSFNEAGPKDADADTPIIYNPDFTVTKVADSITGGVGTDGLDGADSDGDVVNYTITIANTGNVILTGFSYTDDNADGDVIAYVSGDTDTDGDLDLDETWIYSATHTVTQDELDSKGTDNTGALDTDGDTDNRVTVSFNEAGPKNADADTPLVYNPLIDLTKYVDVGFGFDDANTGPGPNNVNIGGDVDFKVTIENTGNISLTDVDITDTYLSGGAPGTPNLLVENGALTAYALAHGGVLEGDDNDGDAGNGLVADGILQVGETWTVTYTEAFDPLSFEPGAHLNTADVTTAEGAEDEDSAYYFSLVDAGLCPRTPGFWQNMKNGGQFWDGVQNNEKHMGQDGFPDGELMYDVDSDGDGNVNVGVKGLLIGDYDHDGTSKGADGILNTADDEDVLFISYADALQLINASNKQLNGQSGDGKYMLGRDMVASWLNYLQGSGFGDASDPQSPHHYLDDAIDWMQIYSGNTAGGISENFDTFKLNSGVIKTNSTTWNTPVSGIDHSASQMHSALDYYNNTGQTQPDGTHYANCATDEFMQALGVYQASLDCGCHSLV